MASTKTQVVLVLQSCATTLKSLKLDGVEDAMRRAGAADERHLELTAGSWHRELESACLDLVDWANGLPLSQIAMAKALRLKLPELPQLLKAEAAVRGAWSGRPGVLRSG